MTYGASPKKRYVQITLVLEEAGILDDDVPDEIYATRMYTLSDPSGILDGELELVCTQAQLERELKNLDTKHVTVSTSSTTKPSYKYKGRAEKEAPENIDAGALVVKLAKGTGTMSSFTHLLGDLVNDLLRPQKGK